MDNKLKVFLQTCSVLHRQKCASVKKVCGCEINVSHDIPPLSDKVFKLRGLKLVMYKWLHFRVPSLSKRSNLILSQIHLTCTYRVAFLDGKIPCWVLPGGIFIISRILSFGLTDSKIVLPYTDYTHLAFKLSAIVLAPLHIYQQLKFSVQSFLDWLCIWAKFHVRFWPAHLYLLDGCPLTLRRGETELVLYQHFHLWITSASKPLVTKHQWQFEPLNCKIITNLFPVTAEKEVSINKHNT
jgi:hypothetical protein